MIAAGIEGGSKRAIEEEWDLHDVAAMREYWRRHGPPLNAAVVAIAASLGVELVGRDEAPTVMLDQRPEGPSIEHLARLTDIKPGCDPIEASLAIARALGMAQ